VQRMPQRQLRRPVTTTSAPVRAAGSAMPEPMKRVSTTPTESIGSGAVHALSHFGRRLGLAHPLRYAIFQLLSLQLSRVR
jgi:hypothetical protein